MDVTPLIIHSRFINIRCPEKDMVQIVCPKIDTGIVSGFTLSMTSLHGYSLQENSKDSEGKKRRNFVGISLFRRHTNETSRRK